MDKQKAIEEMAKALSKHTRYDEWQAKEYGLDRIDIDLTAEHLVSAGYGNIQQVLTEFSERLKEVIHERDYVNGYAEIGLCEEIDETLKEFLECDR